MYREWADRREDVKNDGKIGDEATRILDEERRVEITRRIVRETARVRRIGAKTRRGENASDCCREDWHAAASARRRLVNRNFASRLGCLSLVYRWLLLDHSCVVCSVVVSSSGEGERERGVPGIFVLSFALRITRSAGKGQRGRVGARTGRDESVELRRSPRSFHGTLEQPHVARF